MNELIKAAEMIKNKKNGIAFTGAGMSTASGIPDFRSPAGVWEKYDIREYAYIDGFIKNPQKVWEFFSLRYKEFENAKPNEGHKALAELENLDCLKGVITQNIDSLHFKAGSRNVYELHGSIKKLICLECEREYESFNGQFSLELEVPHCSCGAILKPDVTFFGEALPQEVFIQSKKEAVKSDFMIVAGTSAIVYPAAEIPYSAHRKGCQIIEINKEKTALTNNITHLFLQGNIEEILPELVKKVEES